MKQGMRVFEQNKGNMHMMYRFRMISLLFIFLMMCIGCTNTQITTNTNTKENNEAPLTSVKIALDWTPNTNHTGLYVAKELGYFKQAGLQVEIVTPNESGAEAMVASGSVAFGVSYQEGVTQARTQGVPIVSIAAVIQHNTSGFASPTSKGIKTPKDFEGKTYGGFGSPVESAMIQSVMKQSNADASKVNIVNIGQSDFFAAVKRDIDFSWIFYGWTGVDAELRNEPIHMVYLKDISPQLDYYTPVLITNEKLIQVNPQLIKSFIKAVSQGYQYAIQNSENAADLLLKAAPELDAKLVRASQKWLSARYQDDAINWGIQKQEVWENYANWLKENQLIDKPFDASKAFSNEFLP
jgi:ABC-type nitrate/sulfonate/bicarbonate transport system substrate-binding protein